MTEPQTRYVPLTGRIPDYACPEAGDQLLVALTLAADGTVVSAHVAYRPTPLNTWSPPIFVAETRQR